MPLVELEQLCRSYGSVRALRDVSMRLEPGAIGLVGNNGAGKSTLLKILLGLLAPDSGHGAILGCDVRYASRELRGRIGYMPETAALVPMLRGVEFVTLSGDLYGMPHREARRRAHEVLNYVGLGELRYRRLDEYSAGNQQRLKLAAALVHDPQLLLLDEPTNGLDPAGRTALLQLLKDLIAETGKSVILCTHLLADVQRTCEQLVVLHEGTVICAGRVDELKRTGGNRHELGWDGPPEAWRAALTSAGVAIIETTRTGGWLVETPPGWETRRFFELARTARVVLRRLKPAEEDLAGLFFRVTAASVPERQAVESRTMARSPVETAPLSGER
jgi:ABC-2 type transport system ATP-binding protein